MKRILAVMLVLTLLTTVFSFTLVEAKDKTVSLTGQIIKINQGETKGKQDVLALKCEEGTYVLTGNIKDMNKYIDSIATVKGTIHKVTSSMNVKSFEIIPVPKPVVPSKPVPAPTLKPIITKAPLPNYIELKGTLLNNDSAKDRFLLKTENGIYELMGNTKGLENELGNVILVYGNYVYTLVATEYPLFSVESYTVIERPEVTPDPDLETITGTLTVTKSDVEDKNSVEYNYLLKTQSGPVTLNGKTEGLEKYNELDIEVTGKYSMLKIYPPIFIVESYKVISTPEPTPAIKKITMDDNGGYAYIKSGDEVKLELETNPTTGYDWSYIMKPDDTILMETNYEFVPDNSIPGIVGSGGKGVWTYKALSSGTTVIELGYSRPWESAKPLKTFVIKVIVETPDPDLETITGTLTVTKSDVEDNNTVEYNYLLKTQSGPVTLNGNTEGLEKYNGLNIEATGKYSMLKIYPPIFIVESYKVISTPIPTPVIKKITMDDNGGYAYIKPGDEVQLELETNPTTGYDWSYIMKPDDTILMETNYEFVPDNFNPEIEGSGGKGVWTYKALSSGTTGIEMGYSRPWESAKPVKTFVVKVIVEETPIPEPTVIPVPTVKPEPTTLPYSKTHTVLSEKAFMFAVSGFENAEAAGYTTISWTEGTDRAFFSATLNVGKDVYELELVSVKESDSENIVGLFNLKKNGEILIKDFLGKLYGLSLGEGEYFKFYSEDEKCHMSAYITKRLDF